MSGVRASGLRVKSGVRRQVRSGRAIPISVAVVLGTLHLVGCELTEVDLTQPEDVLVAEVYVSLADEFRQLSAVLHGTVGAGTDRIGDRPEAAIVVVTTDSGTRFTLPPRPIEECVRQDTDVPGNPACYRLAITDPAIQPGSRLDLSIALDDGRQMIAASTVPGDFELRHPVENGSFGSCAVPPNQLLDIIWSRSAGTWAYLSEATIGGLSGRVPPGIEVPEEPLEIIGLSISAADTTISLPNEFGIFDRFGDFRELLELLQGGLPDGTAAQVTVAAVDRNYVNWARGGNFNPSGQVRVPSVRGDGIGVFGSLVSRSLLVQAGASGTPCTTP